MPDFLDDLLGAFGHQLRIAPRTEYAGQINDAHDHQKPDHAVRIALAGCIDDRANHIRSNQIGQTGNGNQKADRKKRQPVIAHVVEQTPKDRTTVSGSGCI